MCPHGCVRAGVYTLWGTLFVQEDSNTSLRYPVLSKHMEAFDWCPWVDFIALISKYTWWNLVPLWKLLSHHFSCSAPWQSLSWSERWFAVHHEGVLMRNLHRAYRFHKIKLCGMFHLFTEEKRPFFAIEIVLPTCFISLQNSGFYYFYLICFIYLLCFVLMHPYPCLLFSFPFPLVCFITPNIVLRSQQLLLILRWST